MKHKRDFTPALEKIARSHVDSWIESGMFTQEMKYQAELAAETFHAFLLRDIRLFEETGKYPKWAMEGTK